MIDNHLSPTLSSRIPPDIKSGKIYFITKQEMLENQSKENLSPLLVCVKYNNLEAF
jgi:hypothetical protein